MSKLWQANQPGISGTTIPFRKSVLNNFTQIIYEKSPKIGSGRRIAPCRAESTRNVVHSISIDDQSFNDSRNPAAAVGALATFQRMSELKSTPASERMM